MQINPGGIPVEVREIPRWVLWQYEERDGKRTKVPYMIAGGRASTTDPKTWTDYASALAAAAVGDWAGIGFVFAPGDDILGIDLDHCREPATGALVDWAAVIVDQINSYTEVTPSETGLHILCRGKLPAGGRRKGGVEIYEQGRYFTVTGAALIGPERRLMDRSAELAALHGRIFAPPKAAATQNGNHAPSATETQIIEKLRESPKYAALWAGDTSGYGSHSEADLALAGYIAWLSGPDLNQIDRVFRQSGLMREKWMEKHGDLTYGDMTLGKAVHGIARFYDWSRTSGEQEPFVVSGVSVVSVSHDEQKMPVLAPEAFYGLPGRIVKTMSPHTESGESALLVSFLVGAGCLVGRGPYVYRDGARHGCNEFACIVGRSAVSRKGTSLRRVAEVFRAAAGTNVPYSDDSNRNKNTLHVMHEENEWSRLQLTGLGSGEALIASLVEAEKEGEADPRRLIVEEEFSRPLKVMRREGCVLSETVRQAWDRGILACRTKGKVLRSEGGHVSMLCHITERELKEEIGSVSLFNGFGNRFLWVYTERSKSLPFGGGHPAIAPLVSEMRQALDMARSTRNVALTPDAATIWGEAGVYDALIDRPAGLLGAITSRAEAHVTRLALIYAVLDMRREIDVCHLLAGLALWDLSERSCARLFGYSLGDDYADLILERLIEVYPRALTRTEIRDGFLRNAPAGRIPPALALLARRGKAEVSKAESGGRPAEMWRAKMADGNDQNDGNDKSPLSLARAAAASLGYATEATEAT